MNYIILFSVLFFTVVALYIYFKRKIYTRERYAFWASMAIISFASVIVVHIFKDSSLIRIATELANELLGVNITVPKTDWTGQLLSILMFGSLIYFFLSIHKNWDGAKSKKEDDYGSQDIFKNFLMGIPLRKIILSIENENYKKDLDRPYFDVSLDWHSDVAEMLKIVSNRYYIDIDKDWYSEEGLFISKFSQQNIAIFCSLEKPTIDTIKRKIEFVKQHIDADLEKLIVAVKHEKGSYSKNRINNIEIEYRYKDELLNSLVDFSEYFDYIKRWFKNEEISYGDKLTLSDIYTKSHGEIKRLDNEQSKFIESVEDYLLEWTNTTSHKQIALLGEYGQGKSVLSLKLAYEMIINKYNRVPIIIELRGKSPRNDQIEDIIGSWARKFNINPMGVVRLMIEGKLLIILEGFDEIDMIGDSNRRLEHFNKLWEFARYEKSKVMITGRPNLFLDNEEMMEYLKTYRNGSNLFYSEAIHIQPFNYTQIENTLRNIDDKIRSEILELLIKELRGRYQDCISWHNEKKITEEIKDYCLIFAQSYLTSFEDLMARPSTLYQASIIWNKLNKNRINSALVIESFLNHAYRRQEEKLRNIGRTGIPPLLTINERKYFMLGIAVGMVDNSFGYTNQINSNDLEKIIDKLYQAIPDKVSFDHPENRTLRVRMKDNKHALESIFNDIRTSTILVRDYSRNDSFKFAHKSFLEYLMAKYFVEYRHINKKGISLDKSYKSFIQGVGKVYGLRGSSTLSEESTNFIVDLLNSENGDSCKKLSSIFTLFENIIIFIERKGNIFVNLILYSAPILAISTIFLLLILVPQLKFMIKYIDLIWPISVVSAITFMIGMSGAMIAVSFQSKTLMLEKMLQKCKKKIFKNSAPYGEI